MDAKNNELRQSVMNLKDELVAMRKEQMRQYMEAAGGHYKSALQSEISTLAEVVAKLTAILE